MDPISRLFAALFVVVTWLAVAALVAVAFHHFWAWFVMSVFDVELISIPQAMSLVLIVVLISFPRFGEAMKVSDPQWYEKLKEDTRPMMQWVLWVWGAGWVLHFYCF